METKLNSSLRGKLLLAVLCLLALAAGGCKSSNQGANGTSSQANNQPSAQDKASAGQNNSATSAPNPPESASEPPHLASTDAAAKYNSGGNTELQPATTQGGDLIVGVWHYTMQYNGYPCQGEDIYQPNGSYSAMVVCGGSATQQTGVYYFLQPGVLRRDIKDYSPKEFRGVPVRMIAGETFQVSFLDDNRMVYGNDVVLYRAQ